MNHAVKGEAGFELAGSKGRGMSGEKHQELGRPWPFLWMYRAMGATRRLKDIGTHENEESTSIR